MWQCVNCGEKNEDQFEACWKCQERPEEPDPDPEETQLDILFDPEKPQAVGEGGTVQCPTCGQQFRVSREEASGARRRSDSALCPHCGHTVTPELLVRVAPAKRESHAEVREVIYACPYCGKVLSVQQL